MYWDVRNVVIEFQMKSPKGKVYASGFLEGIRNALDDYVDGVLYNMALANLGWKIRVGNFIY